MGLPRDGRTSSYGRERRDLFRARSHEEVLMRAHSRRSSEFVSDLGRLGLLRAGGLAGEEVEGLLGSRAGLGAVGEQHQAGVGGELHGLVGEVKLSYDGVA
jgi:hypothetical protein